MLLDQHPKNPICHRRQREDNHGVYPLHQRHIRSSGMNPLALKLTITLWDVLTKVKDWRKGAIYNIKCAECPATYIRETSRILKTKIIEHKYCTALGDKTNKAAHHMKTTHKVDWDSTTCFDFASNYHERCFLESCYTNLKKNAINICCGLPKTYLRLLGDQNYSYHVLMQ